MAACRACFRAGGVRDWRSRSTAAERRHDHELDTIATAARPGRRSRRTTRTSATCTSASSSPRTRSAASASRPRPPASSSTTRRTGSPTRRSRSCCSWPRSRACATASTPCSAARRSTSPRSGPSCTSPCAPRGGSRSSSTARTSSPTVHAVLDRMADFADRVRERRLDGAHRQADPQRRQHRHRRLGPRPGDGLRGAAALQRPRPDLPVRLQRRRHRLRRGDPRPRPGRDAVHRLVEDLHDARDDDQRPDRPRLVPGEPRRRDGGRQALRRRLDQRPGGGEVRHRHREHVRRSGTGSAAATRWTRRSASRR